MKYILYSILCVISFLLIGCNPECNFSTTLSFDSSIKQQGQELLIKTNNPDLLLNSPITFVSSDASGDGIDTRFDLDLGGVVTTVPIDIEGENLNLIINDPDCGPQLIGSSLSVFDNTFFSGNPNFIHPTPIEIVIPTPPIAFPPIVKNAWISPQNLDYCIWFRFVPELDEEGQVVMVEIGGNILPKESIYIDDASSSEFSVDQLVCESTIMRLYHGNPVSGIIDKEKNIINFWIDRTDVDGQNLGIEEFEGSFINIAEAGYNQNATPDCSPAGLFNPTKEYLMMITSKKDGRQLLLYQQGFL